MHSHPIAVFDSGLGGLSVVRSLRELLPAEDIVYFGDTARVPYGTKSRRTVAKFALEDAGFLLRFQPKLIVAACNTASALAMDVLRAQTPVPVIGVVAPGARAAVRVAGGRPIGVIGTEATIASNAYVAAIRTRDSKVEVITQACPLFVPLVEDGRDADDPIVRMVADEYLIPLRERNIAALVLGCTHYPLLQPAIAEAVGPDVTIIPSGRETARAVARRLERMGCLSAPEAAASIRFYVSDNPARFRRIGARFLGHPLDEVALVDPEDYISRPYFGGQVA